MTEIASARRLPAAPAAATRRDHLLLAGLASVALLYPLIAPNDYILSLGVLFFVNLILVASLNLLMGYCGQISLSHGAFFGLGAYTSGVLSAKYGVSALIGLPAALLLAALVSLLVGLPTLRLRGHYLAMATLGCNAIISVLFVELVPLTGGPNGLIGVEGFGAWGYTIESDTAFYYLAWFVALLVMVALLNLMDSRVGRAIRAIAGSEVAASSLGVDVYRYKLCVFVFSGALAALAGVLYVHFNQFASPETFSFFTSVLLVVMVALGGWGRYWGAFFGALIFTAVPELLHAFQDLELFLFGLSMIVVLMFSQGGIAGLLSRLRDAWARRRAA